MDHDTHTYWRDGVRLVGVTEVLKEVGIITGSFGTERGMIVGRHVHAACRLYSLDRLDENLDEELAGYVSGWMTFVRENGFVLGSSEVMLAHPTLAYAGTYDAFGTWMSGDGIASVLIDIKCNHVPEWAGLQLAAYEQLIKANEVSPLPMRRVAVELRPGGTYRMHRYGLDGVDRSIFNAALSVAQWKRNAR
jgi:hypothetical protein